MSNVSIPRAILNSPAQEDPQGSLHALRVAACLNEIVHTNASVNTQEMHQHRIKALRKKLEYLKETEWKYQPVDKYIGQF